MSHDRALVLFTKLTDTGNGRAQSSSRLEIHACCDPVKVQQRHDALPCRRMAQRNAPNRASPFNAGLVRAIRWC
jgi:hypothetical protein